MASILKVNTIQDATNSNTAMSIDSSGRVTQPQHIAFQVTLSNYAGNAGVQGTLTFDQVFVNKGSAYNSSNGRFVAPVAGTYFFNFYAFVAGNTSGDKLGNNSTFRAKFQKNGADHTGFQEIYNIVEAATYNNVSASMIVELAATDYITVNVTHSYIYCGGTGSNFNGFNGHLIG
tara:strand:+ start:267 stop:791 length:525 start_codon:yes stop_codon:yes gene_type:complete